MARGFTRGRGSLPAPQRSMIWSDILVRAAGSGVSTKSTGSLDALGVSASGVTLIRSRGRCVLNMDAGAAADVLIAGVGLGIFSSDAFTAGAASLPGPLTDADYNWVWIVTAPMGVALSGTQGPENITENLNIEIDSKAMRKLKPNQTMGFVAEAIQQGGTPNFDFDVCVRQLFKLG